jgi:hypothetical protein
MQSDETISKSKWIFLERTYIAENKAFYFKDKHHHVFSDYCSIILTKNEVKMKNQFFLFTKWQIQLPNSLRTIKGFYY